MVATNTETVELAVHVRYNPKHPTGSGTEAYRAETGTSDGEYPGRTNRRPLGTDGTDGGLEL